VPWEREIARRGRVGWEERERMGEGVQGRERRQWTVVEKVGVGGRILGVVALVIFLVDLGALVLALVLALALVDFIAVVFVAGVLVFVDSCLEGVLTLLLGVEAAISDRWRDEGRRRERWRERD